MKQSQIGAQIYSFREFIKTKKDVMHTFRKLRDMGYEGLQLSPSVAPMPEHELLKIMEDSGLAVFSSHESSDRIVNRTDEVIEHMRKLNCTHVGYPYPAKMPENEKEVVTFAHSLNAAAKKMRKEGITLAYHNHDIEFRRFGERLFLEIIYDEAPAVQGQIDTFWIMSGGGDPVKWLKRLSGRQELIHLKDCVVRRGNLTLNTPSSGDFVLQEGDEKLMASVGSGILDWTEIFRVADSAGVKCYVVEHDGNTDDPFGSFRRSIGFLQKNYIG